jgi:hypothetical protein
MNEFIATSVPATHPIWKGEGTGSDAQGNG